MHQHGEFSVLESDLPSHRLPFKDPGPDLDQLLVALHALVGSLLLRDVHPDCGARGVNVGLDHCGEVLEDDFHGGKGVVDIALVLGEEELPDGGEEGGADVEVPDGRPQHDHRDPWEKN